MSPGADSGRAVWAAAVAQARASLAGTEREELRASDRQIQTSRDTVANGAGVGVGLRSLARERTGEDPSPISSTEPLPPVDEDRRPKHWVVPQLSQLIGRQLPATCSAAGTRHVLAERRRGDEPSRVASVERVHLGDGRPGDLVRLGGARPAPPGRGTTASDFRIKRPPYNGRTLWSRSHQTT